MARMKKARWKEAKKFGIPSSRFIASSFISNSLFTLTESHYSRVLDVGCGEKPYRILFDDSKEYVGIDKKPCGADVIATAEWLPFRNDCFDCVICTQVLEHVEDPHRALREMHRVLIKGANLLISTHGFWLEQHEKEDYWRWTLKGLLRLQESAGFEVVDKRSMDPVPSILQAGIFFLPDCVALRPIVSLVNLFAESLARLIHASGPRFHAIHMTKAVRK